MFIRLSTTLFCATILAAMEADARADVLYSLTNDWSDTNNPNGVWSYNQGSNPIVVHQDNWNTLDFSSPQPAWALAQAQLPDHVPAWFRSVGVANSPLDMPSGRVIVHGTDPGSSTNQAPANVTWTSPINGTIIISGDTWLARKICGRAMDWNIYQNDLLLTHGSLNSSDPYTSGNPFLFENGTGGPSALIRPVSVGDVITFEVVRTTFDAEFEGVDLTISATPNSVPEPCSLGLLGSSGLAAVTFLRRRKRSISKAEVRRGALLKISSPSNRSLQIYAGLDWRRSCINSAREEAGMSMRNWKMPALVSTMILALVAVRAPAQGPADQGKPAAVVDGTPISMTELEAVLKQAPPSPTPLTDSQKKHMRDEALMMMVDDILLQQFLRKNGPQVDPNEVPKKIAELEVGLKKQNKILQDFLKETGQSEAQLRMSVLSMLQWEAFVKQHLTDDDVKKYYLESKDFFDRTAVRASHIVIRIPSTASSTEREAAKAKLAALKQEIEAGRIDFAEAAKKQSQCTSAPNGGDIGYFPRKMMVEEPFARAAFALNVGQISDVVQTGYGVHLIKVTDRKQGQPSDFNKMKEEVREMCIEEMRMALLAELRKTAHVEINLQ